MLWSDYPKAKVNTVELGGQKFRGDGLERTDSHLCRGVRELSRKAEFIVAALCARRWSTNWRSACKNSDLLAQVHAGSEQSDRSSRNRV